MDINKTVEKLLNQELQVSTLDASVIQLKAIGWQLASKYKFTKDKESEQANVLLTTLIAIRKRVKRTLGLKDPMMERYENTLVS